MALQVAHAPAWAEAVLHVLAYVDVPFPASCFNPVYIARMPPPALDHAEIAAFVRSHAQLVAANALAFAAPSLDSAEPLVGIVSTHAELELERLEGMAREGLSLFEDALGCVLPAAPTLEDFQIEVAAPLGPRGRVLGNRIIVGHPAFDAPELLAWQAAHEATVASLRGGYTAVEREALRLLTERAASAGLAEAHAVWRSRVGPVTEIDDGA